MSQIIVEQSGAEELDGADVLLRSAGAAGEADQGRMADRPASRFGDRLARINAIVVDFNDQSNAATATAGKEIERPKHKNG